MRNLLDIPSQWEVSDPQPEAARALARATGTSPLLAQVLLNRGWGESVAAQKFLTGHLRDLTDPFALADMQRLVERVEHALIQGQKITLFGDYDVDGVTSVVIMKKVLEFLGAKPIAVYLPDRFDDGYGLTLHAVERCLALGKPDLLIVLDCGTNSLDEIDLLKRKGVDVVVLDHHEPVEAVKYATHPILNYKKAAVSGVHEGVTEYCTAGLVFKFSHALLKSLRNRGDHAQALKLDLKGLLDLVALATIADIAPLTGENRILAKQGLRQMSQTSSIGLRALMKVAGVSQDVSGYDCGFKLGPRLNAAGRLESAMAAMNLLLAKDQDQAMDLAEQLNETNRQRQAEESQVLAEAKREAEIWVAQPESRVLVLANASWHEGVLGIVASRIAREFYLPTFVISLRADGEGKGSGRSVEGFDLAAAIEATRAHLIRGGGHKMAAGITILPERVQAWRNALQLHARNEQGWEERWGRRIKIDAEIFLPDLNLDVVEELKQLEPCGMSNPRPVFVSRDLEVFDVPRLLGSEGKHLKLKFRQQGAKVDGIGFGFGKMNLKQGDRVDAVYELEVNEYLGNRKIQLNLREIRPK